MNNKNLGRIQVKQQTSTIDSSDEHLSQHEDRGGEI